MRPSTSPMTFATSDLPARSRRLSTMASGALMRLASAARAHHAADVRRDDDDVVEVEALLDVAHHHRRGEQIVGRDIEEALDLPGMQVEREHAVDAGAGDQVGDELGRDRRARPGLCGPAGHSRNRGSPP